MSDVLLIVDTCCFLDVLRVLTRPKMSHDELIAVRVLKDFADSHPTRLEIATTSQSTTEWADNVDNVIAEMRKSLAQIEGGLAKVESASQQLSTGSISAPPAGWSTQLGADVESFARDLFSSATKSPITDDDVLNANARVAQRSAPARQGKDSFPDCKITECALRIARARPNGSTLFASSNTDDFATAGQTGTPLQQEFMAAGLVYTSSWSAAQQRLRAPQYQLPV